MLHSETTRPAADRGKSATTLEHQLIDLLADRDLSHISIDAGVDHRGAIHFNAFAHGGGKVGASGNCVSIQGAVDKAIAALVEKRFGAPVAPLKTIADPDASPRELAS